MTPVIVLSNAYLSNGSEPFRIPRLAELPKFKLPPLPEPEQFKPYMRDSETLSRPWAHAGLKGYEHRVGGLEKTDGTGNVSHDPDNHELMSRLRAAKIAKVSAEIPPTKVSGTGEGELLVIGWGSTYGAITQAVNAARKEGLQVSSAHVWYMNPLPQDLGTVLRRFRKILVPEENFGQFRMLLRAAYGIEPLGLNKVQGQALNSDEVLQKIKEILRGN
jgi:2-oxoglutarate ferredoxin oxidoreductase subunit alpha